MTAEHLLFLHICLSTEGMDSQTAERLTPWSCSALADIPCMHVRTEDKSRSKRDVAAAPAPPRFAGERSERDAIQRRSSEGGGPCTGWRASGPRHVDVVAPHAGARVQVTSLIEHELLALYQPWQGASPWCLWPQPPCKHVGAAPTCSLAFKSAASQSMPVIDCLRWLAGQVVHLSRRAAAAVRTAPSALAAKPLRTALARRTPSNRSAAAAACPRPC